MDKLKKKRLIAAGWSVGTVAEFLDLSEQQTIQIEVQLIKNKLAKALITYQEDAQLTQEKLAVKIGSSQSRVAKMEAADKSVSIDLLVATLLNFKVDYRQIGKILQDLEFWNT